MKFRIEDLDVYFPYEYIYPEQYEYMVELKRTLDAKGHCVLEMPTGTGKTITLLSLITSYQMARKGTGKLVYCTRTVHEMEKALAELRLLHAYQQTALAGEAAAGAGAGGNGAGGKGASGVPRILALGLSSRKNLCIHPVVAGEGSRESVDAGCRKRTASWVRAAALENPDIEVCTYFDQFDRKGQEAALPPGVYTLQDLRAFGREKGWCPYFLARHMINFANVVVYNYQYLLDPKVSGIISRELERESIVVFDEAHNIDNVCIEALSVNVRQQTIDGAHRNLARLNTTIERFKATDAERLKEEYRRLVDGLAQRGNLPGDCLTSMQTRGWTTHCYQQPSYRRRCRAEHFLAFLRSFLTYLHLPLLTYLHLPLLTYLHLPLFTYLHLPLLTYLHLTLLTYLHLPLLTYLHLPLLTYLHLPLLTYLHLPLFTYLHLPLLTYLHLPLLTYLHLPLLTYLHLPLLTYLHLPLLTYLHLPLLTYLHLPLLTYLHLPLLTYLHLPLLTYPSTAQSISPPPPSLSPPPANHLPLPSSHPPPPPLSPLPIPPFPPISIGHVAGEPTAASGHPTGGGAGQHPPRGALPGLPAPLPQLPAGAPQHHARRVRGAPRLPACPAGENAMVERSIHLPACLPCPHACVPQAATGIESKSLQLCYDRLQSLLLTLQVAEVDEMGHVQCVCDLATLVGTYTRGFAIIIEPFDERQPQLADPVLQVGAARGCCTWVLLQMGRSFLPFPSLTLSTTLRPHPSPPPPLSAPTPLRAHPSPRPPLSAPTPLRAHPSPRPPLSAPTPLIPLPGS
ncbi:unnamed protein product [Closterium sp. NIES-65]|nr:unnamed protein product [Closterium sp. NIES-65]